MVQSDHWDDPNTGLPLLPGVPSGLNRRAFLMRHAAIGAAAVMTGTTWAPGARAQQAAKEADASGLGLKMSSNLSPDLEVVKASKGPVMTVADEFYKVGPGPSSSHTIGPMRITYDFYQRCTQLPANQLSQATGLKVRLFGSLSATGKGHGTERAALAGLVGKEPATVDPRFLDEMIVSPDQTYPVQLGGKTLNLSLADIIYDAPKGTFPHPNTMTCQLLAGDKVLHELEYIQWAAGSSSGRITRHPRRGSRNTLTPR
jgi:L-serine dehydratase